VRRCPREGAGGLAGRRGTATSSHAGETPAGVDIAVPGRRCSATSRQASRLYSPARESVARAASRLSVTAGFVAPRFAVCGGRRRELWRELKA
jgi:hypothetical protein